MFYIYTAMFFTLRNKCGTGTESRLAGQAIAIGLSKDLIVLPIPEPLLLAGKGEMKFLKSFPVPVKIVNV